MTLGKERIHLLYLGNKSLTRARVKLRMYVFIIKIVSGGKSKYFSTFSQTGFLHEMLAVATPELFLLPIKFYIASFKHQRKIL